MLVTIDPYYDTNAYNDAIQALRNNKVDYKEYILTRAPFNFILDLPYAPMLMNYDKVEKESELKMVSKVYPVLPQDKLKLFRKGQNSSKALKMYCENDYCTKDFYVFISNTAKVQEISGKIPKKIYYVGRYVGRMYQIYITETEHIKNFVKVYASSNDCKSFLEVELKLNKMFLWKDKIQKLSRTPYFLDGKYYLNSTNQIPEEMKIRWRL